jgi:pimeloyl-ACP methyl ester carboxylesterase
VKAVLGLAPAADLELTWRNETCGDAAQRLIGGTPEEFPQRYRDGSPAALLPLGLPQVIINGAHDEGWLTVSRAYQEQARLQGEEVRLIVPPDAGHFELVMPASSTFPIVRATLEEMLR